MLKSNLLGWLLITALTGCSRNDAKADQRDIVRAVLLPEIKEWQGSETPAPCVMPALKLRQSLSKDAELARMDQSWLSKGFSICSGHPDTYFALSIDGVQKTSVLLTLKFQCGALCGKGTHYQLDKIGDRWKVTDRADGWVS